MEPELQNPEKALEYKEQGNSEFKSQNYIKAIEFYSKAIQCDDTSALIYGNRAACYLYQQCINDCDKSIKIDINFTKSYLRRARSQMMLGNLSQAFLDFSKSQQLQPNDKSIEVEFSKAKEIERNLKIMQDEYNKENYNDTITFLNQILLSVPDWRDMQCIQIECLSRIGALDKASKIINQIQYELQQNPDFLYARGIYALYNNQLQTNLIEKARQCFLEGCKLDPDHSKSRITYQKLKQIEKLKDQGNQCLKEEKYEEAIKNYSEALEVDPSNKILNAILCSNKAVVFMKLKNFKEALEECNKSIELNEKYYKSYLRRAEIKMELEQFEEAVYDYNKVKELDSTQNVSGCIRQAKERAKRARQKDYYKILGIGHDATDDEIKKAYKKLAIKWHPDKHQGEDKEEATKQFREIAEAYAVLSDKKKRQMVDQGIDPNDQTSGLGGNIDPTQIFSMFFGGGMGGGRSQEFNFGGNDFGSMFGGRTRSSKFQH